LVVLYYATGALGICLGYHRLLTHRSLKVAKPVEWLTTILGVLALQGGPIEWIATHRAHHAHSDRDGDPHDIHKGLIWSHMEWIYRRNDAMLSPAEQMRLAPDLAGDPFYRFMEKTNVWWTVGLGIVLFAIGGWSWLIWGVFVRIVLTYHITWLVNSAAHYSGYQSFRTADKSMNNHHAFPFSARHGLRWFEFDVTWTTIKVLAWMKLARDIKLPTPQMLQRLAMPRRVGREQA
jgi:stearoyl-CoA desaturase (delta-9 desaturase)